MARSVQTEGRGQPNPLSDELKPLVVVVDPISRLIVDANIAAIEMFGGGRNDVIGASCRETLCPGLGCGCPFRCDSDIETHCAEHLLVRPDGVHEPYFRSITAVTMDGARRLIESFTSLGAVKRNEQALMESEEMFKGLVEVTFVGVYLIQDERFVYVNPRFAEIFGYTQEEITGGMMVSDLIMPDDRGLVMENIRRRLSGEVSNVHYSFRGMRKRGVPVDVEVHGSKTLHGGRPAVIGTLLDLTERRLAEDMCKESEKRAWHVDHHDQLTSLPNFKLFERLLGESLDRASGYSRVVAVIFLDLDRFKTVNEILGRRSGDRLLACVAGRLMTCLDDNGTVARFGGDEFGVLLWDLDSPQDVTDTLRKVMECFEFPFTPNGAEVYVTASVGAAFFPDDGHDAQTLLKNAESAMYRAKEKGKNNLQTYTPAIHAASIGRARIETLLRKALDKDEFELHYQPQVEPSGFKVVGVEALLRWHPPGLGAVGPARFIPISEDIGMIGPIGEWVIWEACRQYRAWRDMGFSSMVMAVNISARQFQLQDVVGTVERAIGEYGVSPEHLEVEITESVIADDVGAAGRALRELGELGVRIAIDDFGTGYSSFGNLKRFLFHTLKIDRSFIKGVPADQGDAAIATAICAMAKTLDLDVVAEGVETIEQLGFAREIGCARAQGFLFAHALPAADLAKALADGGVIEPCAGRFDKPEAGG